MISRILHQLPILVKASHYILLKRIFDSWYSHCLNHELHKTSSVVDINPPAGLFKVENAGFVFL